MKHSIIHTGLLIAALATGLSAASCNKEAVSTPPHRNSLNNNEICFSASGLDIDVNTRASVVSNLDGGFYAIAATGAAGSQSNYWGEVVSVTKSGSSYLTGKYWPASDPGLTSFYASNVSPTFAASGPTVTLADCNTDVVCAHAASPTYGVNCPLTFNHVLARVGTITLNTKSGYELSSVTATLKNGVTGGTYNLRTGAWSSLGAGSDKSTGAFSGNTSAQTSDNDIWLIPGTYTISLSYTLTKGDYVYNAVNKTGSVTILAGNTNNITTTAVGVDATEIVFSVSLTPWSPNDVALDMTFRGAINPHPFTLNGHILYLANSNMRSYYGNIGSLFFQENPWDYSATWGNGQQNYDRFGWATSGYNSKYPTTTSTDDTSYGPAITSGEWTEDSEEWDWTKFSFWGMELRVLRNESEYIAHDTRGIPNLRTPTASEMSDLFSSSRRTPINHTWCEASVNSVVGYIFFSDDYTHPGECPVLKFDRTDSFTGEQFLLMQANGAVFFPTGGFREGNTLVTGSVPFAYYWTSTAYQYNCAQSLYVYSNSNPYVGPINRSRGCFVRLVQDLN